MKTKTWVWVHPESRGATLIEAKTERQARAVARRVLLKAYRDFPIEGFKNRDIVGSIQRHFEDAWFLPVDDHANPDDSTEKRFYSWFMTKDTIADELVERLLDWVIGGPEPTIDDYHRDVLKEQVIKRMSDEDAQWYVDEYNELLHDGASDAVSDLQDQTLVKCGFGKAEE